MRGRCEYHQMCARTLEMSHLRPIEMSDCPSSVIVAWEADDFGMGADERTRRTTRESFDGGTFRPTDSCLGGHRAGDRCMAGPLAPQALFAPC